MDPRLYIENFRRPRPTNPTFNSSNVIGSSFSIYRGGPLYSTYDEQTRQHREKPEITQHQYGSTGNEHLKMQGSSQLSQYGEKVLKIEDRDIYNLQKSKYNIISMEPKEHPDYIKQYPKFSLEDKDLYHFQKVMKMNDHKNNTFKNMNLKPENHYSQHEETLAGKLIYEVDKNKIPIHMSESYSGGKIKNHQQFSPKMLNHADQFRNLM